MGVCALVSCGGLRCHLTSSGVQTDSVTLSLSPSFQVFGAKQSVCMYQLCDLK